MPLRLLSSQVEHLLAGAALQGGYELRRFGVYAAVCASELQAFEGRSLVDRLELRVLALLFRARDRRVVLGLDFIKNLQPQSKRMNQG